MEVRRSVTGSHDGQVSSDRARPIMMMGRTLLTELGQPLSTTGNGLASVVLPAGTLNLLVLGIPVPVFGYIGDDDQEIQSALLTFLRDISGALLNHGCKIVLRAFSHCQDVSTANMLLDWLPQFRSVSVQGEPALLGTQLVTLYPFSNDTISKWPLGPEYLVRGIRLIELAVPELYRKLDGLLSAKAAESAGVTGSFLLFGE